jgi:hypothetical protein
MHLRKVGVVVAALAACLALAAPAAAHRTVSWASFGLGMDDPVSRFAPLAQQENTSKPQSFARCVNGKAAQFPCDDVDLLSYTPLPELGGAANAEGNDVWGATIGPNTCDGGLHVIDVREPKNPKMAGCYGGDGYTHACSASPTTGPTRATPAARSASRPTRTR